MFGGGKGPLEALKEILGERKFARRTQGSPARSHAMTMLWAYSKDYDDPDYLKLAEFLSDAWAGEQGLDSQRMIQAVRAAAPIPAQMGGGSDDEDDDQPFHEER